MEEASPGTVMSAVKGAAYSSEDKGLTDEEFFAKCLAYAKHNCKHCHGRGYLRVMRFPAKTFTEEACGCAKARFARNSTK